VIVCLSVCRQVFPHEYRRVLAERAMAAEQEKLSKQGSFILQYQEVDIISEELLKKEAVRMLAVCLSVCLSVCVCVCVCTNTATLTLCVVV